MRVALSHAPTRCWSPVVAAVTSSASLGQATMDYPLPIAWPPNQPHRLGHSVLPCLPCAHAPLAAATVSTVAPVRNASLNQPFCPQAAHLYKESRSTCPTPTLLPVSVSGNTSTVFPYLRHVVPPVPALLTASPLLCTRPGAPPHLGAALGIDIFHPHSPERCHATAKMPFL
jgi:hypothetical protein